MATHTWGLILACASIVIPAPASTGEMSVEDEFLLEAVVHDKPADFARELAHGANPDVRDAGGRPVIFLAAASGHPDFVRALLQAGAKAFDETHEWHNIQTTALALATWNGREGEADALLRSGADWRANELDAWRGAVVSGSTTIVQLLLAAGADPGYRFKDGESPVMIAALRGHAEALAALLDRGGAVNFRDNRGSTALMFAAAHGQTAAVRVLLEKGAKTWPLDTDGVNAYAASNQNKDAASRAEIQALLQAHDAQQRRTNRDIDNQLLLAAHDGNLELVKSLLAKGADLEVRGEPNITLWLRDVLSASVAHPQVCEFLIHSGVNLHALDGGGFTALHSAVAQGSLGCVNSLLAAGLDPNVRSNNGQTPLFLAEARRRPPSFAAALRAAGAKD